MPDVRENAFSTETAALADRLRRTAGLLGRLAEHCRPGDRGGTQLEVRVQVECRQLLAQAGALDQCRLKVAVIGDFDAGKSTLISALAGKQLLPMHPNPATALVTWITHAAEESYYLCPNGEQSPRIIPGADFRRYHHGGGADGDAAPVDHLEALLPFPLLSQGVVLLDTPGFDNGPEDTARTHTVISDCSGLILCTPAVHPLSERDLSLLKALVSPQAGAASFRPDQLFLVLTYADAGQFQDDPALMGNLMAGLRTRLVSLGGLGGEAADDLLRNRTVAVSGRLALRSRLKQDLEDELASGVRVLEEQLHGFFLSLQAARLEGARSALASAAELHQTLCRGMRAQTGQSESQWSGRVDELQQRCQKAQWKLERLDKQLAASQQDFADRLPGIISRRLEGANLSEVANPTRIGLAAITNTVLNRWNTNDRVRTAKVLQEAVEEISRRSARHVFSDLLESERLARVAGNLKKSLLDLLAAPPATTHGPVLSVPNWPAVVDEVMAGMGGALEKSLSTTLMESPSMQQCAEAAPARLEAVLSRSRVNATWAVMKQAAAAETFAESDERRRSELFLGICEVVGAVLRATDAHRLVEDSLPEVFAELRLHLRKPISEQLQRWNKELERAVEQLDAERRWVQSVLPLLEDIEA